MYTKKSILTFMIYATVISASSTILENIQRNDFILTYPKQHKRCIWQKCKATEKSTKKVLMKAKDDDNCGLEQELLNIEKLYTNLNIISPKKIRINKCTGKCSINDVQSFTNHALSILLNTDSIRPLPHCVPTQYEPITIFYLDKGEILKKIISNMIAVKCGCR
ncbi:hypothetical protein A3Q56_05349 [Intoshia linei]|uniref:TGF-beta family profile domain-containing protein n=1 Tax=Intoshia linei TaxID=1819745 RepID=A0A177AZX7_9BILA|nr:hypothetical protein A3Q56_05349 [Intoshia linei]